MRFGYSIYFNLFWLLAALPIFLIWAGNKKQQLLVKFCDPALLSKLTSHNSTQKQQQKSVLLVLAVFFIILALTRPQWGYQWKDLKQEGVDIIIALDVSNSMLAEDLKPNRLERAKHKITDLLNMMEGDRVGLVAFAGTSFVQCPLTLDYSAVMIFLDILDTDLIPTQGTDLGQAIRTSIEAFSPSEKKSNAIILITD
ncbi:MAG: VWA domain-containing protein, partial [Nitrospinales bacterium]